MAELMFRNTAQSNADMYDRGYRRGQQRRTRELSKTLMQEGEASPFAESLMSAAQGRPRSTNFQGALNEMAAINPDAAFAFEGRQAKQDDARRTEAVQVARGWQQVRQMKNEALERDFYQQQIVPFAQRHNMPLPQNVDPAVFDREAAGILAMQPVDPASAEPAAIRELRILQANPELAKLDMDRRQSGSQWEVLEVPTNDGGARQMERNRYTGQWREPNYGGGLPAQGGPGRFGIPETDSYVESILSRVGNNLDPNASPQDQASILLPYLIQQESGGDPNAVSPKGARGATQVMPATGRDPGFGVRPLQNDSNEENVRFGRDYLTAMLNRYPGRPDLALGAYNAGPGRADGVRGQVAQNGSAPRMGFRPPKQAADTPVRTLTMDEVRQLGMPAGSVVQQSGDGTLKTVYSPKSTEGEGGANSDLNPRQRNAVQGVQRNLIQYSASLTGKTPEEIRAMSADDIAKEIVKSGKRFVQGGTARVMSNFPGGETAVQVNNSDIVSYAQGAGAAWANYENPTGTVTNADRESATLQMPNPYDPPDVQASKIKNFLELSGYEKTGVNASQQSSQPVRVQNAADYYKLPSGATYITPDGQTRRKR